MMTSQSDTVLFILLLLLSKQTHVLSKWAHLVTLTGVQTELADPNPSQRRPSAASLSKFATFRKKKNKEES